MEINLKTKWRTYHCKGFDFILSSMKHYSDNHNDTSGDGFCSKQTEFEFRLRNTAGFC